MKKRLFFIALLSSLLGCKELKKNDTHFSKAKKTNTATATTDSVKINPIEHATMVLYWGATTIYIDPVGEADTFDSYKKPDLILITDIHGDHFSLATLESLDTSNAKIILPQAVADKMPKKFIPQLDVLSNGETKERFNSTVEAVPMYNLRTEALNFHPKGRGNGYVLTKGTKRIYISGDTEDIPEMRALKNIDIALVCMNLPYTMTVESAASAVLDFAPKKVYPYHYRGKPAVSKVADFKKIVTAKNSAIDVIQLDWYPNDSY